MQTGNLGKQREANEIIWKNWKTGKAGETLGKRGKTGKPGETWGNRGKPGKAGGNGVPGPRFRETGSLDPVSGKMGSQRSGIYFLDPVEALGTHPTQKRDQKRGITDSVDSYAALRAALRMWCRYSMLQ